MCKRGDVYFANLPKIEGSSMQYGIRPVIIFANDKAVKNSSVIQCIPITTKIKREDLPVHAILESGGLEKISMVLGEQLRPIDKSCLLEKTGTLSEKDMETVENLVLIHLGYQFMYREISSKKLKRAC
jgi:mRNA interferase MazF